MNPSDNINGFRGLNTKMTIAIGCDHAGIELKKEIISLLHELHLECIDYGTEGPQSVDYPDFGEKVSEAVHAKKVGRGILICGTGIGMSLVAIPTT